MIKKFLIGLFLFLQSLLYTQEIPFLEKIKNKKSIPLLKELISLDKNSRLNLAVDILKFVKVSKFSDINFFLLSKILRNLSDIDPIDTNSIFIENLDKEENLENKFKLAHVLIDIISIRKNILPILIETLKEEKGFSSRSAFLIEKCRVPSKEINYFIPDIIEVLSNKRIYGSAKHQYILNILIKVPPTEDFIKIEPILLECIKYDIFSLGSAHILINMNSNLDFIVSVFNEDLTNKDFFVRLNAMNLLLRIPSEKQKMISLLLKDLENKDLLIRRLVAETLINLQYELDIVLPIIFELVQNPDFLYDSNAIKIISNYHHLLQKEKILPVLLKALQYKEDKFVRIDAAKALSEMNIEHEKIFEVLSEILQDENLTNYKRVIKIIEKLEISEEKILPVLIKKLEDEFFVNFIIDNEIIETLGDMGKKATMAIPLLNKIAQIENPNFQKRALEALEKINRK